MADAPTATTRHAVSAMDKQRAHLSKLLKDPTKPVFIPPPPKEKTLRPPREMMKNVQGSSAGAGSGEFHVYKANRRREYERIKMMEEQSQNEVETAEFERKRKEREEQADAKTAKNRLKRNKKKEKAANKQTVEKEESATTSNANQITKKRRIANGVELVFKRPGTDAADDDYPQDVAPRQAHEDTSETADDATSSIPVAAGSRVQIIED